MPGISIHVVDVSRGIVAEGMRAELWSGIENAPFTRVLKGQIDERGLLAHPDLARTFAAGRYRAVFDGGGATIAARASPLGQIRFSNWSISIPASPSPSSTCICPSNARRGNIPVFGAAHDQACGPIAPDRDRRYIAEKLNVACRAEENRALQSGSRACRPRGRGRGP
jgi:hypothetical protein